MINFQLVMMLIQSFQFNQQNIIFSYCLMKKKNELSRQPINLMPYRLKTQDSLDYNSNRQPYKPKFIFQLMSSPDNSFSEMIKDFRSKGQQFKKVPIRENDFEGPSSIHPQKQKIKQGLAQQNIKWQSYIRSLQNKNSQLICQIQFLQQKLQSYQNGTRNLQQVVWKLQDDIKNQKDKIVPLENRIQALIQQNKGLKQQISSLQFNIRKLKQTRSIASKSQHDSVKDTKEVYQNISTYLKNRVQNLLTDIKKISMSPKLEGLLQDFFQQILLINEFTVKKNKKKHLQELQEVQEKVPFTLQRVRLDKSIQKLKQLQKELDRQDFKFSVQREQDRRKDGAFSVGSQIKSRVRSRSKSKSARRRIFN